METIPASAIVAVGAITAAIIGGLFSYFNLILSKEQKLSDLRQQWIDGLRDNLSNLCAALLSLDYLNKAYKYEKKERVNYIELSEALREPHMRFSTAFNNIVLRLNPTDDSTAQQQLIQTLKEIRRHSTRNNFRLRQNFFLNSAVTRNLF